MRIKDGLIVKKVMGDYVVMASNSDIFKGMLKLNETGYFIFKAMKEDIDFDDIVEKLTDEYDVSKDKAEEDLKIILDCLDDAGLIVK